MDFTGAFLQGSDLDREVILIPPPDYTRYEDGKKIYWKLVKPRINKLVVVVVETSIWSE